MISPFLDPVLLCAAVFCAGYPAYRAAGREPLLAAVFALTALSGAMGIAALSAAHFLIVVSVYLALIGILALARGKQRPSRTSIYRRIIALPAVSNAYGFIAAALFVGFILNMGTPPGGWDALTYHLEFPLQWLERARPDLALTDYGDLSPTYYPMLASLWYTWLYMFQSASADTGQIFFWPILWLSLREILRRADLNSIAREKSADVPRTQAFRTRRALRELTALLGASCPYALSATLAAENDLAMASLLALAHVFFLRLRDAARRRATQGEIMRAALAWGAAAGLAASVKYVAVVYLAALVVYALLFETTGMRRRVSFSSLAGLLFLATGAALAVGGFWYMRNFALTGNPVYPGEIKLFGTVIFPGYYKSDFMRAHPFHDFSFFALFKNIGYMTVLWPLLALLIATLTRAKTPPRELAAPLLLFAAFYFLVPWHHPRLLLPVFIFCVPLLWRLLDGVHIKLRFVIGGLFTLIGANILIFVTRLAQVFEIRGLLKKEEFYLKLVHINEFDNGTPNAALQNGEMLLLAVLAAAITTLIFVNLMREDARALASRAKDPDYTSYWPDFNEARLLFAPVLWLFFMITRVGAIQYYESTNLIAAWNFMQTTARAGEHIAIVGANAVLPWRGHELDRTAVLFSSREKGDRPLHERYDSTWSEHHDSRLAWPNPPLRDVFERRLGEGKYHYFVVTTKPGFSEPVWHYERAWIREIKDWQRIFERPDIEIYAHKRAQARRTHQWGEPIQRKSD